MPVKRCQKNNKPGWKWGNAGKCYTYAAGDKAGSKKAKKKAIAQGVAIGDAEEQIIEWGPLNDMR